MPSIALAKKGLYASLKPEEALVYLYDGRMVGLSSQAAVGSTMEAQRLAIVCMEQLRHPDHTTIAEVDKSLFWLQTSVQTFLTYANRGFIKPQLGFKKENGNSPDSGAHAHYHP